MAGFEFETRLRLALREAAEREAERGRAGRAVARSRSTWVVTRRSFVSAAAAVLGTLLALAVAAVILTGSGSEREAVQPPEVVARFTLGESPGGTVGAYGSVWVADTGPDRHVHSLLVRHRQHQRPDLRLVGFLRVREASIHQRQDAADDQYDS